MLPARTAVRRIVQMYTDRDRVDQEYHRPIRRAGRRGVPVEDEDRHNIERTMVNKERQAVL